MSKRLVVLVSGGGTNLQAVLDACAPGEVLGKETPGPAAEVVAVVSNRADAYGLKRARLAGVPAQVLESEGRHRQTYDMALADVVSGFRPDLVVMAGWMRILTSVFLDRFPVINLHPALPGTFPGTRAIERAFEAWQAGLGEKPVMAGSLVAVAGVADPGAAGSGVMVHWVPDEGVDVGPVLVQESVPFLENDSLVSFENRIHLVEHRLLVQGIALALSTL